jgi:hypothetical protein
MNAHLKTLMNVSGIAKRNGRFPLIRAGKVCVNTLKSQLVYPLNHLLRPFDVWIPRQKLVCNLAVCLFPLSAARFDDGALIQSP